MRRQHDAVLPYTGFKSAHASAVRKSSTTNEPSDTLEAF